METLAKLGQIGGGTTESINQGLRQMAQGFGKNKLDGDELRSVIENLLPVAQLLAKELGFATVAGLQGKKGAGAKGLIDRTLILTALSKAAKDVDEQFANLDATVGSEVQKISDKWTKLVGKINEATGATKALKVATGEVGNLLDSLTAFVESPTQSSLEAIGDLPIVKLLSGQVPGLIFKGLEVVGGQFLPEGDGTVKEENSGKILDSLNGLGSELTRLNEALEAQATLKSAGVFQ